MIRKIAIYCALVLSTAVAAQNGIIRGTVYEDETSEPLFYANAQIPSENAVAFTDFDGHFELSLAPGTYSLEISFLGSLGSAVAQRDHGPGPSKEIGDQNATGDDHGQQGRTVDGASVDCLWHGGF